MQLLYFITTVTSQVHSALIPWMGPYKITEKVSKDTFEVKYVGRAKTKVLQNNLKR